MEVHAHSHTERKKWTHYFWEFLMLFLAVFCGFLAEYKLEQTIEKHREKEFIESMIEDAATDTTNIHVAIIANQYRIKYTDSLALACFHYNGTRQDNTKIYKAHRNCIYRPDLVYPTDRTLFQLKNSGGMRLIRKKKAAEIIIAYDNGGKSLINQQAYYEAYLTKVSDISGRVMNFLELWDTKKNETNRYDSISLINADKTILLEFGNNSLMFNGILQQYVLRLQEMEKKAVELIDILKKEYHLK